MTGWRWPRVVGKVEANPVTPLEYAKIWQARAGADGKPVKFGTISPQCIHGYLDVHTDVYDDDRAS